MTNVLRDLKSCKHRTMKPIAENLRHLHAHTKACSTIQNLIDAMTALMVANIVLMTIPVKSADSDMNL